MMPAFCAITTFAVCELRFSILQCKIANRTSEIEYLFRFFDVHDLPASVRAGLRVDTVWHLGLARVFVEIKLRSF